MLDTLTILTPLLLPLLAGLLCITAWKKPDIQQVIYLFSTLLTFSATLWLLFRVDEVGVMTYQAGNWKAPFGISLAVDMLGALMLTASALLSFVLYFFARSHQAISKARKLFGFYPAVLLMSFGIHGAFITGDLFNLYVWFEVMVIGSFVLLTLGSEARQLEGAVKYVTINFIASSLFLTAIGIMYGVEGSTNMADLSVKLHDGEVNPLAYIGLLFFIISFGIKAALFPLYFWLPASYHTPPAGVSAIIAGLLTKVGIYAMFRVSIFIFPANDPALSKLFLILAGSTMLVGMMGAIAQTDYRRVLSYMIVSHMGYMVMGLGIGSKMAITGAIFYILHSIIVKANLFFMGGIINQHSGSFSLKGGGGIYRQLPVFSVGFFICAMSLAGIPPLTGFWGKYVLAQAGLISGNYIIVGISLATGLLTLLVMNKVWLGIFLKNPEDRANEAIKPVSERKFAGQHKGMYITVLALSLIVVMMSFLPEQVIQWSSQAAESLINRDLYIEKVLGSAPKIK